MRSRFLRALGFRSPLTTYRSRSRSSDDGPPPSTRRRSFSPPPPRGIVDIPRVEDVDPVRRAERERQLAARLAAVELEKAEGKKGETKEKEFDAMAEFAKLTSSRSGGVYMPPARLRALQAAAAQDRSSAEYQRLSWDALRKSITGIVNRVNVGNIKHVVPELFSENLIRGRGLFARSIMKAQAASLPFTPVFAALVSIINTKLPMVGELLLHRLVSQFRRAFKRNDKVSQRGAWNFCKLMQSYQTVCHSTTTFIGHLVNQAVAHELIALQILVLLLERPTDDSIEIAVGFTREVGAFLQDNSPKANATVFERFRAVLNEGNISHRVQYMIEVLMQVRKDKYKDNPILPEGLDLVEEEEQITHEIQLEEDLKVEEGLSTYPFGARAFVVMVCWQIFSRLTQISLKMKKSTRGSRLRFSGRALPMTSQDQRRQIARTMMKVRSRTHSFASLPKYFSAVPEKEGIEDRTETNLVNLRRVIYLTIMNALNYEEAVHKLLKVQLKEGEEVLLCFALLLR